MRDYASYLLFALIRHLDLDLKEVKIIFEEEYFSIYLKKPFHFSVETINESTYRIWFYDTFYSTLSRKTQESIISAIKESATIALEGFKIIYDNIEGTQTMIDTRK